jgi:hypothetical protein
MLWLAHTVSMPSHVEPTHGGKGLSLGGALTVWLRCPRTGGGRPADRAGAPAPAEHRVG